MDRLRVVVRADLAPGQQAVQGMHAQRAFAADHKEAEEVWFHTSNTLAFLSVPDEPALYDLLESAHRMGIRTALFKEPDIGDRLTAICLEPGEPARRLCQRLPLALRGR